jgi:signal peptidase I
MILDQKKTNTSDGATENIQIIDSNTSYKSLIIYTLIALAIAIIVRFFVAAPYIVSGASMDPTFKSWDYLIIDRLSWHFEEPVRGDVVVFKFPQDPTRSFIKRVIGLPGDTVVLSGTSVKIKNSDNSDGFLLEEEYIADENMRPSHMIVSLTEGEYFVLGDNRLQSADSRVWGVLPRDLIVGRPIFRLFPFSKIELLPGEIRYQN